MQIFKDYDFHFYEVFINNGYVISSFLILNYTEENGFRNNNFRFIKNQVN